MRRMLLGLLLVASAAWGQSSAGVDHTLFPDGSDSIGIPRGSYIATCFMRDEYADNHTINCGLAQRINSATGPIDCATHARRRMGEPFLPLPNNGKAWRQAHTGWCMYAKEVANGRIHYPACHAENYQYQNLRQFGPADCECWYPSLPGDAEFVYIDPETGNTFSSDFAPTSFALTQSIPVDDNMWVRVTRRPKFGAYRLRFKGKISKKDLRP